ncbi:Hypothetical protein PBC10988_3850 [Planctomycetales bacterium 10988]|nr:Hypothetical protein PBC10988_3850 [Planctomycetales bacterium 10988]
MLQQCPPELRPQALRMLWQEAMSFSTDNLSTNEAGLQPSEAEAENESEELSFEGLYILLRENRLFGVLWIALRPGKTATIWGPSFLGTPNTEEIAELRQAIETFSEKQQLKLLQSVTPTAKKRHQELLHRLGFEQLTERILLETSCESNQNGLHEAASLKHSMTTPLDFRIVKPDQREAFWKTLIETQQQSQDCPQVSHVLADEDWQAIYEGIGERGPGYWRAAYLEEECIGCLLLDSPLNHSIAEILYMGIIPAYRQQGLGRQFVSFAKSFLAERHKRALQAWVDMENTPAMQLYQRTGFSMVRQEALLYRVAPFSPSAPPVVSL